MLDIKKLSVTYPDKTCAISDISFLANDGDSIALIGANGAGKTSLIMAIMGVLASTGEINIDGIKLDKKSLNKIRYLVGVVFQNPDDQLFMPTIYDDIAFGLRNRALNNDLIDKKVNECLLMLNIHHLKNKTALKLSGGEKRMVALATVLVMNPKIMIFDEPTAFLDPRAKRTLTTTLNSLPQIKLIATHDLSFANDTCKRTILLKKGKLFANGLTEDILSNLDLLEECGV